ncbi:MAG TPA: carbon starvation protein A, partial [Gemmatimonadetes bacterium]|nr:carbon starvation protein A [Gemmatimonadota bacterium]
SGQGGMAIWPLFGTTNQLLAGLTLLVLSVMLVKLKRRYVFTMVPMVFVTAMSFFAAIYQLWDLFNSGSYVLMGIDVVIIILAIFVILESGAAFTREKRAADAS